MKKALNELKDKIAVFAQPQQVSKEALDDFIDNCTVALMAGGEGSRIKNVTDKLGINKNALELPGGETMIERTLRMYASLGIKNVVALVFHQAESIKELLGDGTAYGVELMYSHDPEHPVGKGGAVKNALLNGSISESTNLIVHNPDDQIVGDTNTILKNLISDHLAFEKQGGVGTVAVVEGAPLAYSGMKVEKGKVTDVEMYPFVPIPSHVGITIFSPKVYPLFHSLFDLSKKTDFEQVLFPELKKNNALYASKIPTDSWIPVNDEKGLKKLIIELS